MRAEDVGPAVEELQPDLAFADPSDPNPGSGSGQILAGWIAFGIGVAGVAQAPICKLNDFDERKEMRRCRRVGAAFGAIGLGLAVPWLIFGYQRRAEQRAWKKRHGLTRLTIDVDRGGLSVSFRVPLF